MSSIPSHTGHCPDEETAHLQAIIEDQHREITQLRQRLSHALTSCFSPHQDAALSIGTNTFLDDRLLNLALPALMRGLSTRQDVTTVSELCKKIVGTTDESIWHPLVKAFYEELVVGRVGLPPNILALEHTVAPDWFRQSWYSLYVQQTAVHADDPDNPSETTGDFDSLRKFLPFIRNNLGFYNVCLLPHYESPMADGGYDVSAYTVRQSLGGVEAFGRFMDDAMALGIRVGTYGIFSHTSTEHVWFQHAVDGDSKHLRYYVLRNGREKIAEIEQDGDVVCHYRDSDGTTTQRTAMVPDVDRTHGLWVEINGGTYQFYRTFFPHEVDLNLRNPDVLTEIFKILAAEVTSGILCKRMTAVTNWIKVPGETDCGGEVSHAVLALLKMFFRLLHARAVVFAEASHSACKAMSFSGEKTLINGEQTTSEADGVLAFEMQQRFYESICLQTTAPLWKCVFASDDIGHDSVWINVLESHDQLNLRGYPPSIRGWLCDYFKSHGGTVFDNGLSAVGRLGDLVSGNAERAATGLFLLYLMPGVAMVYSGSELCVRGDWVYARRKSEAIRHRLQSLGVYVTDDASFDRRELHRAPLLMKEFVQGVKEKLTTIVVLQRLNRLFSTVFIRRVIKPVDSYDISVLAAIVVGHSDNHRKPVVAIAIANLTPLDKILRLPVHQLKGAVSLDHQTNEYQDMLTQTQLALYLRDGSVEVTIGPYGRYLLTRI